MSEYMRGIPFGNLMNWILTEYQNDGAIFGMKNIYHNDGKNVLKIFDEQIEAPFGPAAGPHNQLAQNIITAYAGGARFFELKTVQVLDGKDLPVNKPCISAGDECYNCEWSTELTVPEALEEYMKAWYALKILSKELELGDPDSFVFNMSVGYDYDGIQTEKIQNYIDTMRGAKDHPLWKEMEEWALANVDRFKNVDEEYIKSIPDQVSDSITLSTLHGCPPQEIEKIASYLINEKGINTFIKCNPTMLGYDDARKILDDLGYDYMDFDDYHFTHDLQYVDAIPMFQRLMKQADEKGVDFGLKITNTFPQKVTEGLLPDENMYMSGRSLFPVSIELAKRLAKEFDGKLRISYSGGADAYNIGDIFEAGIWPITIATTILKPGGYGREKQLAEILHDVQTTATTLPNPEKVEKLADDAKTGEHYQKGTNKKTPKRKIAKKVPLADCFTAGCSETCPINQNIPEYLRLLKAGKPYESLKVITDKNPLPFMTGTICSHHCQTGCARNFYEGPVQIRSAKLEAAMNGIADLMKDIEVKEDVTDKKTAIIGAGPAGIAAAHFLRRNGVPVTLFDKNEAAGGVVRYVIPKFRIENETIEEDANLMRAYGIEEVYGEEVTDIKGLLDQGYDSVIIATGAWKPMPLKIEGIEPLNALEFLEDFNKIDEKPLDLGKTVVVVGGGNTAMDTARAAKRVPGVEEVILMYRRTTREMPADDEELTFALEDGVTFMDLTNPESYKDGVLTARIMELGEPDESGRRRPVETDKTIDIPVDTVIASIGSRPDKALLEANGGHYDERGRLVLNPETLEIAENIYVAGDTAKGASDVVHAIADARAAADAIMKNLGITPVELGEENTGEYDHAKSKRGVLNIDKDKIAAKDQADRCLECNTVCEACVDVCPNRANIAIKVPGAKSTTQVIHVDRMCNECGNCIIFCPYDSAPYKEKFTLFNTMDDVRDSENAGFLVLDNGGAYVRVNGEEFEVGPELVDYRLDKKLGDLIRSVRDNYGYLL